MLLKLVLAVYTIVYTGVGPVPVMLCIYKTPEIDYNVRIYQPPWEPCAMYRNV